jgi:hypothetical protein
MSDWMSWTPAGFQELLEDLLHEKAPDGRLQPLLVLGDDDRGTLQPFQEHLFQDSHQHFARNILPKLIADFGARGAALICSLWATNFAPDDLSTSYAYRLHVANGGTLSNWPGRIEAVSAIVAERQRPTWAILGLLERHQDAAPTISKWEVETVARRGTIARALEEGLARGQVIPLRRRAAG